MDQVVSPVQLYHLNVALKVLPHFRTHVWGVRIIIYEK